MALRLRTRSEARLGPTRAGQHSEAAWQRLVVAGLVALALLALGEAAPAAFLVDVRIEGHGAALQITVDGQAHAISSVLGPGWQGVTLEQPGPVEREYQVDGSDTTSNSDRQPEQLLKLLDSPLYQLDAWLRDEGSYSRWERLRITDLTTGEPVASTALPNGRPSDSTGLAAGSAGPLPHDFLIEVALRRPEAPARLWLVGPTPDRREGLELDRDRRNARWLIMRGGGTDALPRWFFPENPAPFAAEILQLAGRSAAAAYALGLVAIVLGLAVRRLSAASTLVATALVMSRLLRPVTAAQAPSVGPAGMPDRPSGLARLPFLRDLLLATWLLAAALVSERLYHQLPHIFDAVSYTFQAGLFAAGRLALEAPPLANAFKGPFEVLWQGKLFSQYPPGAPAAYALGQLVSLEWLVGPLACLALIATTAWTASALFGRLCGLFALVLGVISPFVLFQAGSFLSHPIAGGLLAGALAAFVAGERRSSHRWYALSGVLLGAGFLTREVSSVLFALPLGVRVLATRRRRPLTWLVLCGVPFVGLYLLYNAQLTGSPLLLPRTIFDPSDHFGFGDGIGFHTRHTLAAGLANTDELLTLLQFDLFGWPPLFALGLLGVPFLFGRCHAWDVVAAFGALAFVVAFTGYFYHGIALGPRYYFEAMPWLLLLAARGAQVLTRVARGRVGVAILLGALTLNTLVFYLPAEIERRTDFSALAGGRKLTLGFVQNGLLGPHLTGVPDQALVVTDDWWLYNTALVALNCPRLPDCGVLFALATNPTDLNALRTQFPDRTLMRTVYNGSQIDLVTSP